MTTPVIPIAHIGPPPRTEDVPTLFAWLYTVYAAIANSPGSTAATAAELDYNHNVTPGVASSNKTLVLGSNKTIDAINITQPSINNTALTSTASELNVLHNSGLTFNDCVDVHSKGLGSAIASLSVGTISGTTINTSIQLYTSSGAPCTQVLSIVGYISDNSNGSNFCATAPNGAVAIGTNGALIDLTGGKKIFQFISNSSGQFDVNVTQSVSKTFYWVMIVPYGILSVSPGLAF